MSITTADIPEAVKVQLEAEIVKGEYSTTYDLDWKPVDLETYDFLMSCNHIKNIFRINKRVGWKRYDTEWDISLKEYVIRPDAYYDDKLNGMNYHNQMTDNKIRDIHLRPYSRETRESNNNEIQELMKTKYSYSVRSDLEGRLHRNRSFIPTKRIVYHFNYNDKNYDKIIGFLQNKEYADLLEKMASFKKLIDTWNENSKAKRRTAHGTIVITPEKTDIYIDWTITRTDSEWNYTSHTQMRA
jgi:hypothetical protein